MDIAGYLDEVVAKFRTGQATEHSYRPALARLFESIDPTLTVINEPKRSDAGMPDFIFQRKDVPVGWVEAKDIDKDVIKLKGYSKEQRKRYEAAYPNLIYTNGVDFEFIREGEPLHFVSIADFVMGLQPNPERFDELARQLNRFAEAKPISIRSAAKLAEIMAAKAAIIKDEIGIALADDPEFRSGLGGQFRSFQANLLPNLTPGEFADIYAETITYGMFAARFHDTDMNTFSRQEAMEDLPASNPFLKGLFEYIAGPALPKRLEYIVDDLVQVMRASNPHDLFRDFGKFTARNDPFVHFYEDFLAAYNPRKRKARGVWYTPEPVVDFIVRAVDDVLKTEFGLADGLADTSKVTVDWDTGQNDPKTGKPRTIKKEVHKVQILDPATGTGTFLAKAVQLISDRVKARAPGKWSAYVEEDLLPRLHGFELLMASYAMCHMKLDMMLEQTGYKPSAKPPRLSVWLTNALEPAEREVKDLFFQPLAEEARGASEVKRQTPIMCVIGNPPYSGESANKGDHIMALMEAYKKEPDSSMPLQEHNTKWINDDYVKFIRMAENVIAKNPSGGILGFITNHGYIDNPTFRGMRWHLLQTFDQIHIFDLKGSVKKASNLDGSTDQNVFDIQQGVAIIVAARLPNRPGKPKRLTFREQIGSRPEKYKILWSETIRSWPDVQPTSPYLFFKPVSDRGVFDQGVNVSSLFKEGSIGILTKNDNVCVAIDRSEMEHRLADFRSLPETELRSRYNLKADSRDWQLTRAKNDVVSHPNLSPSKILYRLFDTRYTFNTGQIRGFLAYPKRDLSAQFKRSNLAMLTMRQLAALPFTHAFVADRVSEQCSLSAKTKEGATVFHLYSYPPEGTLETDRTLNFDSKLHTAICKAAGIDPAYQAAPNDDFRAATGDARPSEVKVFDYIYGVLHSPAYRETFAEFLKIDFPRIPYPPSPEVFRHVSEKGEQLRRLHLMEPAAIGETPYPYEGEGDDVVANGFPKWEGSGTPDQVRGDEKTEQVPTPSVTPAPEPWSSLGRVHINKDQYFAGVPEIAWDFHIGGYQPAQKWLKDRRGRSLSWDNIGHYQKIVKILVETDRIMREIELPLDLG